MVLEGLGKSLRGVLGRIGSASSVDDELIKDICKDLQRALLEADVNVRLVLDLTNKVKDRALNEPPAAGRSMKDHVTKIIYEELVALVNSDKGGIALKPQTIMMVGLYGQGKTTTTGKLALYFSKKGLSVGLIGADVYRVSGTRRSSSSIPPEGTRWRTTSSRRSRGSQRSPSPRRGSSSWTPRSASRPVRRRKPSTTPSASQASF